MFLRFAWGRERLPLEADFTEKSEMKIFPSNWGDGDRVRAWERERGGEREWERMRERGREGGREGVWDEGSPSRSSPPPGDSPDPNRRCCQRRRRAFSS